MRRRVVITGMGAVTPLGNSVKELYENQLAGRSGVDFIKHFEAANKVTEKERHCRMLLAMAASYDPDPSAFLGIRLPGDAETAELIPERWANWLRYDPVVAARQRVDHLLRL